MEATTATVGWVALASLLVGFLVRLAKSDSLTIALSNLGLPPIPKRALPWLALGLGLVSSVLDHRMMGTSWAESVIKGFIAAVTAIAGHEVGVESIRKGKELLAIALIVAFGSASTGCHLLTKDNLKTALDATATACIFSSTLTDEKAVADACGIARELLPVIRNLIGQREAAKRAGVRWPGADAGEPVEAGTP